MELSDAIILFTTGFLFGLMSQLFYAKIRESLRQTAKALRPIKKVKYISPKLNKDPERAGKRREIHSNRKVANR
ncbi:MAG: hypothetical protein IBX64_13760 [Actinobacteria bacterium]|nr:hypothetical protein [Actinomycetota bacterium]